MLLVKSEKGVEFKMKVTGKKGLGSILKIMLQIGFVVDIFIIIAIFIYLFFTNNNMDIVKGIFTSSIAVLMLIIIKQFIGLFDSLKIEKPFCEENIKRFKKASLASGAIFIELLIATIFNICIHEYGIEEIFLYFVSHDIGMIFLTILFLGVSIALYILSELFKQANDYKSENDLTI